MVQRSRQNVLNSLYNHDIAPEDSEITSFYYHKTLALESIIAMASLFTIALSLTIHSFEKQMQASTLKKMYNIVFVFSCVGVVAIVLKKFAILKWTKEKKETYNLAHQMLYLLLSCIMFLPCPSTFTDSTFTLNTYSFERKELSINSLITVYLLIYRFLQIVSFLIHSELFYGSRPDRLSRLYTVKFGTFNAIKFLINEKPGLVIAITCILNFSVLPFAVLIIEGNINQSLASFGACLHFVTVTQVTVGYGDVNVATIFGRMVAILIILVGVTNTSLLLILFMRLMELSNQEEESHFLLESLERKVNLTKARVIRIENEWIHSNTRCTREQFEKKQEEIKAFRYNNRRDILLDRVGAVNIKRLMVSNFSQISQALRNIQEKNNIIKKCIDVIRNASDSPIGGDDGEGELKNSRERREHARKMEVSFVGDDAPPMLIQERRDKRESGISKQRNAVIVFDKPTAFKPVPPANSLESDLKQLEVLDPQSVSFKLKLESFKRIILVEIAVKASEESPGPKGSPYGGVKLTFEVTYGSNYEAGPTSVRCLSRVYHPNISYSGTVEMPEQASERPRTIVDLVIYLRKLLNTPKSHKGAIEKEISQQMQKDYKLYRKIVDHTRQGLEFQDRFYDVINNPK